VGCAAVVGLQKSHVLVEVYTRRSDSLLATAIGASVLKGAVSASAGGSPTAIAFMPLSGQPMTATVLGFATSYLLAVAVVGTTRPPLSIRCVGF
jgi:hypothetical protein